MKKFIVSLSLVSAVAPFLAFADAGIDVARGTFGYIIYTVASWINYIVPVLVALAIAYFIWGVISFMTASDDEKKKNGKSKIVNGLIGLFVIVAFWGIISLVKNTFGVNRTSNAEQDAITNTYLGQ